MKLKRKHKKWISIAAIIGGVLLFFVGAYLNQTTPPELPMDHPGWFERSSDIQSQEFRSWLCMGIGGFAIITAASELWRQATKLKV